MNDTTAERKVFDVDAPALGEHVQLVEASVGDMLPIITAAESGTGATALMMRTLAVCLLVDGKRLTLEQIYALPASAMRALSKLGPRALSINGFGAPDVEGQEDDDDAGKT